MPTNYVFKPKGNKKSLVPVNENELFSQGKSYWKAEIIRQGNEQTVSYIFICSFLNNGQIFSPELKEGDDWPEFKDFFKDADARLRPIIDGSLKNQINRHYDEKNFKPVGYFVGRSLGNSYMNFSIESHHQTETKSLIRDKYRPIVRFWINIHIHDLADGNLYQQIPPQEDVYSIVQSCADQLEEHTVDLQNLAIRLKPELGVELRSRYVTPVLAQNNAGIFAGAWTRVRPWTRDEYLDDPNRKNGYALSPWS